MSNLLSPDSEQFKQREIYEKAKGDSQSLFDLAKQAMESVYSAQVPGQINGIVHIIDGALVYTLWMEEEEFDADNNDNFGTDGICTYYGELRVAVSSSAGRLLVPKEMFRTRKKIVAPWERKEDDPLNEQFDLFLGKETSSDILQLTLVSDQIGRVKGILEQENSGAKVSE